MRRVALIVFIGRGTGGQEALQMQRVTGSFRIHTLAESNLQIILVDIPKAPNTVSRGQSVLDL